MSGWRITEGRPDRLGLRCDASGADIAVASETAERIELCLFDGPRETARLTLPERTGFIHHGRVEGLRPGQLYGLRAHGPWDPAAARRFNPAKLLLDPWATALSGRPDWHDGQRAHAPGAPLTPDPRDSAPHMPRCIAAPPPAPVDPAERPRRPWSETLIYEAHVRALTRRHPDVPAPLRGTYEALGHPAILDHLDGLGVTALELQPIACFADEPRLVALGLTNHWGYNPAALLAPEPRFMGPGGAAGLREAIRALHARGIEVILDVVANHTAELEAEGPMLSLRGLCDAGYYRHAPEAPARGEGRAYVNWSGCGNTLDLSNPMAQRLVLDALRHWAEGYGVDGFRFDLAPVLGRDGPDGAFDAGAGFLDALRQDPVLAPLKLIAEPWDLGPHGYRLGDFPAGIAEWNDRFRDDVRGAWRGDPQGAQRLAGALLGSAQSFDRGGRPPTDTINFVAAHDGFTLADQTAYAARRNQANGEDNRDGHGGEISDPLGPDGPSQDPAVQAARGARRRALMACVALSQGTPMLLAGDELGRTQQGNNNAYCQDNETTWIDWAGADAALLDFARRAFSLRARLPALRQRRWLHGEPREDGLPEVEWLNPAADGPPAWEEERLPSFQLLIRGAAGLAEDPAPVLIVVNLGAAPLPLTLPPPPALAAWRLALATAAPAEAAEEGDEAVETGDERIEAGALRLYEAAPA